MTSFEKKPISESTRKKVMSILENAFAETMAVMTKSGEKGYEKREQTMDACFMAISFAVGACDGAGLTLSETRAIFDKAMRQSFPS